MILNEIFMKDGIEETAISQQILKVVQWNDNTYTL